jgi:ferredoxin
MIRIEVNRETCNGYGNCVIAAESVFELDDEGLVTLKRAEAGDEDRDAVRRAVYDCPTDSIALNAEESDAAG